jgi:F0F1-type ATP synthase epsilon subunit
MGEGLLFHLLTPVKEVASCHCDAVNLCEKDGAEGWGGGSIGILRGHVPAVIALEEGGSVRVTQGGKTVFEARVRGGFARVDGETVTVLTPEADVTMET